MTPVLHEYQKRGVNWILERESCGLFLQMGSGKTLITLKAIDVLINDAFAIDKVLIIGPKRVIETTWPDEIAKWDFNLSYSLVTGSRLQREKALEAKADIYLISKDNVKWLCDHLGKAWNFDLVVVDELSAFKNPQAKRFKALRKMPYRRFIGLTGTPSPKGYIDLWSELFLMDKGQRLGKTLGAYRTKYFNIGAHNGNIVYEYLLRKSAAEEIQSKIKDICMSISAKEYSTLPEISYFIKPVTFPDKIRKRYENFKKNYVLEDSEIVALNAAVLVGKLSQFTSGACIKDEDSIEIIHNLKLEALQGLIEEAEGEHMLIFYTYVNEKDRLLNFLHEKFPELRVKALDGKKEIDEWNRKEIDLLLLNPASAGHGLNLQAGGRIAVYFSLPMWNLEQYEQAIARLYRQGQKEPVLIYHILAKDTIDQEQYEALHNRSMAQKDLLKALQKEGLIENHNDR